MLGDWKLYSFKNLSAPLWAELYINGGWVLLIVGMFIVGRVIARLDDSTERILATSGRPSVAACILPFYLLIVLRGSLLQSVAFMAVIILASAFVRSGGGRSEKPPAGFSEKHRRTPSRAYEQMLERPPARSG
ncbi:conserved hypothetical protein [Arthrobacter sp. Hiyo6]|nr:conserved hypothetical protein [Arthrobacter sp. Hiyo6]